MFNLPFDYKGFHKYLTNTNWMFLGQFFSLVVSFFVGTWLGRYLGPENYGVLSYVTSFVGIFSFIAGLGVENIITKLLVENKEKTSSILGTTFVLKFFGGLLAILIMFIAASLLEVSITYRLWMLIFSLHLVIQSAQITSYYFQANVKASENTKAIVCATVLTSLLKISFILFELPFWSIFAVFMLDSLWQAIGLLLIYRIKVGNLKTWNFDWKVSSYILKHSWYLMFASAASFVLLKIDQIIVKYFLGEESLGIYAAAIKFVEIWYFVPTIILLSLFPAILNARLISESFFKRRILGLYALLGFLALLLSTATYFLAETAIINLFGSAYLSSIPILKLYTWSNFGLFLIIAINQYLIASNRYKLVLGINLITVLLNITLNFIFIPMSGLMGAVFATLISYTLIPIVVLFSEFVVGQKHRVPKS